MSLPLQGMATRWLAASVLLAGACLAHAATVTVTDDGGTAVTLRQPPQRIVSLLPSLTETVCALGACQRLVGVDRYSNFPDSVTRLAQVGGGLDPNIEAIVALRPDVVLVAPSARAADRLRDLGLTVVALEPKTHADVQRVIRVIGQLLQVSDADRLWRGIDAAVAAAAKSLSPRARGLRVYFEVSPAPHAAGAVSFIGETLTRLGAKNIVAARLGPFPQINPEFVVRADPDVILVGDRSAVGLDQRPGWAAMRAMREQRLCVFSAVQTDDLVRPGPRMAEGARAMAACLESRAP